jgi:hypothetical protein
MLRDIIQRARKNAKRIPRRERRAWDDYARAMSELDSARLRLAELRDEVDLTRDTERCALEDAADAVRRLALPLDRHAA